MYFYDLQLLTLYRKNRKEGGEWLKQYKNKQQRHIYSFLEE